MYHSYNMKYFHVHSYDIEERYLWLEVRASPSKSKGEREYILMSQKWVKNTLKSWMWQLAFGSIRLIRAAIIVNCKPLLCLCTYPYYLQYLYGY